MPSGATQIPKIHFVNEISRVQKRKAIRNQRKKRSEVLLRGYYLKAVVKKGQIVARAERERGETKHSEEP